MFDGNPTLFVSKILKTNGGGGKVELRKKLYLLVTGAEKQQRAPLLLCPRPRYFKCLRIPERKVAGAYCWIHKEI